TRSTLGLCWSDGRYPSNLAVVPSPQAQPLAMFIPDFRYALRSLSHARGFSLAVILTLGLGIGANTAIFSVVRGVLLKPLPHRDGDRLVFLRQSAQTSGGEN